MPGVDLACLLWAVPGREAELASYEDTVLALLPDHGGQVRQRLTSVAPTEIQLFRFADQSGVDSYLADPRRLALAPARDRSVARTHLQPVPPMVDALVALDASDAGELLTLQRAAYATEAQTAGDPFLPPLTQTLDELRADLAGPSLGIRTGGRLVGSIRWQAAGTTAHLARLVVAPDLHGNGLGTALLRLAEAASGAARFELFTGAASAANLRLYEREGYREAHRSILPSGAALVHLAKPARHD